ncbi:MAG: response regulator transcription factor [Methylococcales bacterium]|nr:response regulator transcription factor [Methylococcales bacterium]
MGQALRAAADEGLSRIFLDAGESLVPLLQRAVQRQIVPQFSQNLLENCEGRDSHTTTAAPFLLTEREQEILILIAQGLSTRQIAEDLVLTAGTIKWHTHNIYRKLDVHSRVQAVNRALELGLPHSPK